MPTSGETVTTRSATSGASRARSTKKRPNACCVDSLPRCSRPRSGGIAGGFTTKNGGSSRASRRAVAAHSSAAAEPSGKRAQGSAGSAPTCSARSAYCCVVEQRRVVGGVALRRQRPALDRVREHDARPVAHGVGLAVAVDQRAEVVAAEVAERRQQLAVVEVAGVDLQPLAQLAGGRAQQPLVLLVRHLVDPLAQLGPGGEPRAVLDHHAVPAGRLEHRLQPPGRDVRHDAVERLAVEVDDPHHLAELAHHRVRDRLPARALVELGVPDQRDLAAADRDVEVAGGVAVRDRAPDRRGGAEPDRAGRVVDRVRVLRPRRVGLQPAVLPQRREVRAVEPAEQVVERVQDGRRVRLHADAVGRLEHAEPERGHERDHRRARRLVAADLHARAVRAHAVGVVDDRGGQPQHAALDRVERLEVDLRLRGGRSCH